MVQRITIFDAYSDEQLKEMGVERPVATPPRRRLDGRVSAAAACIAATALCPAWAAGWVLGAVAALAVAREAPP